MYYAIVYICDVYCFFMNDCQPQVLTAEIIMTTYTASATFGQSDFSFFFPWEMELQALGLDGRHSCK